ncbi:unnamed protein product [Linum trigynum]|uniref:Secreted protein n=1 Tax=Linum trigynum TaxID=586398 RepID=A0AAV2DM44_9ROSI
MASLVLLLSQIVRPQNPNLVFVAATRPRFSFSTSAATAATSAVSSSASSSSSAPTSAVASVEDSEMVAEIIEEPLFCVDMVWP